MQTSTSGGVFAVSEPCRECRGRGMVVESPCPTCNGSGRGQSTRSMQVRIPAGVTDGQRIRIKGKGGTGENSGAAGDLYVLVHVLLVSRLRLPEPSRTQRHRLTDGHLLSRLLSLIVKLRTCPARMAWVRSWVAIGNSWVIRLLTNWFLKHVQASWVRSVR